VLYGAGNLLKEKRISHIYFEHNVQRMTNLNIKQNEAEEFLKDLGYVVKKRSNTEFYAYPENNN